jgi:hypothetical protein
VPGTCCDNACCYTGALSSFLEAMVTALCSDNMVVVRGLWRWQLACKVVRTCVHLMCSAQHPQLDVRSGG